MYEATTQGFRVRATPTYDETRSDPRAGQYFWLYEIEIINDGQDTAQLITRRWIITDANGQTEEVSGPGVVGETPTLGPGERFSYTSGCPLRTPSGVMRGSYGMRASDGHAFDIEIPAFSLDSPESIARPN